MPDKSLRLAREFSEFNAQVQLAISAQSFGNRTIHQIVPWIHLGINLGIEEISKACKDPQSTEKCKRLKDAYQQILDAAMVW